MVHFIQPWHFYLPAQSLTMLANRFRFEARSAHEHAVYFLFRHQSLNIRQA